ncbi:MAG: hypothetical protein QM736_22540 [Vicinamibacterales bacterium]
MDAVRVGRARLQVRARGREMDAEFSAHQAAMPGVVVALPRVARLRKIRLTFTIPPEALLPGQSARIVLRSAAKQGDGFTVGPPLFADPGFDAPGPMFPRPLSGMSVAWSPSGAVLTLPFLLGDAWFVQLATGDEAVKLTPIAISPAVSFVRIDAVPRDLVVTLKRASESPQIWGHPDLFLPDAGTQDIDFSPLAQKQLTDALAAAQPGQSVTLPVTLDFSSSSGGDLAVASRELDARYTVDAAGAAGTTVELGGSLTPFTIDAPAALRPVSASIDVTVTPLGRELNAGSTEPPTANPTRGVRVRQQAIVAVSATFVARDAQNPGASPLVSVRLRVHAPAAAEAVVEIRAAAAGIPGAVLGGAAVRQIAKGFDDWLEFELPSPWTPSAAESPLWVSVRTNSGDVYWFTSPDADPESDVMASVDGGATWGSPQAALAEAERVLVQLFNAVPDPQPEPAIRVQRGSLIVSGNLLRSGDTTPVRTGPREFTWTNGDLPIRDCDAARAAERNRQSEDVARAVLPRRGSRAGDSIRPRVRPLPGVGSPMTTGERREAPWRR